MGSANELFTNKDYEAACHLYESLGSENLDFEEKIRLAHCYFFLGKLLKARATYLSILEQVKLNRTACIRLASVQYDCFEYESSLEILGNLLEELSEPSVKSRVEHEIHKIQREIEREGTETDKKVKIAEHHIDIRWQARAAYAAKNYSLALELFDKLESFLALRAEECLQVATSCYKSKKFDLAKKYIDLAETRGLNLEEVLVFRSDLAIATKDYDSAEQTLSRLNSLSPSTGVTGKLGTLYYARGEIDLSLEQFSRIFSEEHPIEKLQPQRLKYATLLRAKGREAEALQIFDSLVSSKCGLSEEVLELVRSRAPLEFLQSLKNSRLTYTENSLSEHPLISMVVVTMRPEYLERSLRHFEIQNYENKEMVLVLNRADFSESPAYEKALSAPNVRIVEGGNDKPHGTLMREGIIKSRGSLVAIMDDDDEYGPRYIENTLKCYQQTGAKVVGKKSSFLYMQSEDALYLRHPGLSNCPVDNVTGSTIFVSKEYILNVGYPELQCGSDSAFLRRVRERGDDVHACDEFGYLVHRSSNKEDHTWAITDDKIKLDSVFIAKGKNLDFALGQN